MVTRRRAVIAAVVTAGLAVYWSYSRSALAAFVPVVIVLALLARNRILSALGLGAVVVGLFAWGLFPAVTRHLSAGTEDVSVATRLH